MKGLFESVLLKAGMFALDNVLDQKESQEFIKNIGRTVGEEIPGDVVEPKINKAIDLVQEGIKETYQK